MSEQAINVFIWWFLIVNVGIFLFGPNLLERWEAGHKKQNDNNRD